MEALSTTATSVSAGSAGGSLLRPSRTAVLAMAAYVVAAFLGTWAVGDLGDVGFWFVWLPVVFVVLYLPVAGVVRITDTLRRGRRG